MIFRMSLAATRAHLSPVYNSTVPPNEIFAISKHFMTSPSRRMRVHGEASLRARSNSFKVVIYKFVSFSTHIIYHTLASSHVLCMDLLSVFRN